MIIPVDAKAAVRSPKPDVTGPIPVAGVLGFRGATSIFCDPDGTRVGSRKKRCVPATRWSHEIPNE